MKIRGVNKVRRVVRRIQKRFAPKGLILLYHRIAEADLDPWSLCVTPQHFAEHLAVLKKHAQPLSLQQLAQAHREGNIPNRAVAITFDDGYADNLYNAKPLLERYQIPATVFVVTGQIEQAREFWWDELERLLLQPGKLPETLSLEINSTMHTWQLDKAAVYSQEDYQRDHDRRAWQAEPGSRLHLYYMVWQGLQSLAEPERLKVLDEISAWANVEATVRPTHRSLRAEEICALSEGEWIEVGAHTVTHPYLSSHSVPFQQNEIQHSRASLEKILSCPVTSFAYPFGNYTEETVSLVQAAGFSRACSTIEEPVWQQSDDFQLPRFEVQDWNGAEFEQRFLRWFRN